MQIPLKQGLKPAPVAVVGAAIETANADSIKTRIETSSGVMYPM